MLSSLIDECLLSEEAFWLVILIKVTFWLEKFPLRGKATFVTVKERSYSNDERMCGL